MTVDGSLALAVKCLSGAASRIFGLVAWVMICVSILIWLANALMHAGAWKRTESFQSPFAEAVSGGQALYVHLAKTRSVSGWLTTGGDNPVEPSRSTLTLWANGRLLGPAHTAHEEIRTTGSGAYSHWDDYVVFSLPPGVDNSPSTRLVAEYSPQFEETIIRWSAVAFVAGIAIVGLRLHRKSKEEFENRIVSIVRVSGTVFRGLFLLVFVAIGLYLATTLYGLLRGYFFPNAAIFALFQWATPLAINEPRFPYYALSLALLGTILAWSASFTSITREAYRKQEHLLLRLWQRFGFIVPVGLFLFSVGGMWHGIPRSEDLSGAAIAGLVPFNDAGGHFQYTFLQTLQGHWEPFAERRPFAAAMRSVLMFFAGYSSTVFLLLQTLLLAIATHFATRAVMQWRGFWAGLAYFALAYVLVRPYLPTHLTEPFGIFWSLVSVPFLVRALRSNGISDSAPAFLATCMSQLTRMGSLFTIPGLGLWMVWANARNRRQLFAALLSACLLLLTVALVNQSLLGLYGSRKGEAGSNFAYVACGLTHGGNWTTCPGLYSKEIQNVLAEVAGSGSLLPDQEGKRQVQDEAVVAGFLYRKAWDKLLANPSTVVERLVEGERHFVDNVLQHALRGYALSPVPWFFWPDVWLALVALGLAYVLARRREAHELRFWILMAVGIFASAPLIIFDDGWRVLSGSFPIIGLLLASGLCTPVTVITPQPETVPAKGFRAAVGTMCAVMVLCLTIPGLAYRLDPLDARKLTGQEDGRNEVTVFGGKHAAGFLVVADNAPRPVDVPAIPLSSFIGVIRYSQVEQYQKLITPVAPATPFGFVAAPALFSVGRLFIAPPEVIYDRGTTAWRFTLDEASPWQGPYWFRVSRAVPLN